MKQDVEMADFAPHPGAAFDKSYLMSDWCRHLAILMKRTCHFDDGQFPPLSKNMTSFTKQEVHNVLHRHQRRIEPC